MSSYTHDQTRNLLDQVARGSTTPRCPHCGAACALIRTPPREDVAYVRHRMVLRCARCRRTCALEARERGGAHRQ